MNDVCTGCGEPNPPGTQFCLFCGIYLGWADREDDRSGAPAPGPSGVPAPEGGRAAPSRVDDTQTIPRDRTEDLMAVTTAAPAPPATPAAGVATAPVAPTGGTCPSCGTTNDTSRKFCGRCGAVLATGGPVQAPAPRRRSAWQRLLRSDTRLARRAYRRSLPALYRWRRVGVAGLVAVLLGGGVAVAGRDPVGFALDRWYDLRDELVVVEGVSARTDPESAVVGDNAADHVLDSDPGTAWVTGWTPTEEAAACGQARGGRLTLTFPATRVRELRVITGVTDDDRQLQLVPSRLDVLLPDGTCTPLPLGPQPEVQEVELDTEGPVTQLTISIGEVRTVDDRARDVAGLSQVTLMARPARDR